MKKSQLFGLLFYCFSILSCSNPQSEIETVSAISERNSIDAVNVPNYSSNELIIQYKNNVTEIEKQEERFLHGVLDFEICGLCSDLIIEKWTFGNNVDIEHKKISIKSSNGGPEGIIKNVDNDFDYDLEQEMDASLASSNNYDYQSKIVGMNNGVTIAVLDTGIDAHYPLFPDPFLYRSSGTCTHPEYSGWDFVNNDDNCYDDYHLIHGTKVAYYVNNTLRNRNIPHQILPVKVCDRNGVATYFNILCGLNYALPKSNIIQMSLGWYDNNSRVNSIFIDLLQQYEEQVLVVTSAGNSAVDNDVVDHFPSSYPQSNVVAVAAANNVLSNIASFSNYGNLTVDFYAPGEDVKFYTMANRKIKISGTSFAAPIVSAFAAESLYNSGMSFMPIQIISDLQTRGTNVTFSNPVHFNVLIN